MMQEFLKVFFSCTLIGVYVRNDFLLSDDVISELMFPITFRLLITV